MKRFMVLVLVALMGFMAYGETQLTTMVKPLHQQVDAEALQFQALLFTALTRHGGVSEELATYLIEGFRSAEAVHKQLVLLSAISETAASKGSGPELQNALAGASMVVLAQRKLDLARLDELKKEAGY